MLSLFIGLSIQVIITQWKNHKKNSLKECVFAISALKIQCHVVKNILLRTAFSAILPTGKILKYNKLKKLLLE